MHSRKLVFVLPLLIGLLSRPALADKVTIELVHLGTYASGIFDPENPAAEIVAHDPQKQRLFVVNGHDRAIDVLDIKNPVTPTLLFSIDVSPYGDSPTSVAVYRQTVAVAMPNDPKTDLGKVVFFDTDGKFLSVVTVGALPDMLTFTPNGKKVLVANEGEPNDAYTIDPEGSVSIIDLTKGAAKVTQSDVTTASFSAFNGTTLDSSIRIFGANNPTVAQDVEPEYITIAPNWEQSGEAWVTLQENNAIAVLDVKQGVITKLIGLGFKDHSLAGNRLDASNQDVSTPNLANWPVKGMYLPDTIASFRVQGQNFLVTANEGDAREYDGLDEQARVRNLILDPTVFPNATALRDNTALGRLRVTNTKGDTDGDGDFDELFSFGARSFSIWTDTGTQVFDSGDDLEEITAAALPTEFNSDNEENDSFDSRSDDKGPEPEALTVGKIFGRTFAFIGLERIGGVMVYDVSNPFAPSFVQYINNRDFTGDAEAGTAGDLGPEGLIFIPAGQSPNSEHLLVVANEVSGTTTIFQINRRRLP